MKLRRHHIVLICLAVLGAVSGFAAWLHFPESNPNKLPGSGDDGPTFTVKGRVIGFGAAPDGSLDKLMIAGPGANIEVHFPPHAAKAIMTCIHGDSVVTVTMMKRGPQPHRHLPGNELITISNSGDTVRVRAIKPPPPMQGTAAEVSGNRVSLIRKESGAVSGILVGSTLVSLPPNTDTSLLSLLDDFRTITVQGYLRDRNSGFVNPYAADVLQPTVIVIDSVRYLIR